MRHSYIDTYSQINSYIHRIDPRIKIVGIFALVLAIIFTPPHQFSSFGLYFLFILILILLSKIPLKFIFKRSLVVIPFVLMVAVFIPFFKKGEIAGGYSFGSLRLTVTYSGLMILWNVLAKSYLSVLNMILLVASTRFSDFLKALEKLKIPHIFTMVLSFMYRYIFVIEDELMKMNQAKESRWVGKSKWRHIKTLANMVAVLFIRAYERGEQVYLAMCSRGFRDKIRTLHNFKLNLGDVYFLFLIAAALTVIRIIGV